MQEPQKPIFVFLYYFALVLFFFTKMKQQMLLCADLYTPTASLDVLSKCLKRMAMGSSRLVARLKEKDI